MFKTYYQMKQIFKRLTIIGIICSICVTVLKACACIHMGGFYIFLMYKRLHEKLLRVIPGGEE